MTLAEYLAETGESQRAFARRAQVSDTQIWRLCNGHGDVGGRTWVRIAVATKWLVRPEDHFPPDDPCTSHAAA